MVLLSGISVFLAAAPIVFFRGEAVHVETSRVSAVAFNRYWNGRQRPLDQTKIAYFAQFDFTAPGVLKVNDAEREVNSPGHFTFPVDSGKTEIHVFANPVQQAAPSENEIRFAAGEHFPEVIAPTNGQTVVLEQGAIVHGTIFMNGVTNVTIRGRGILDLSELKRADPESKIHRHVTALGLPVTRHGCPLESDANMSCTAIVAYGCKDIRIEGIVIRDSPRWTIQIRNNCQDVTIDGVKIVGCWRYNCDGIDICSSSRVCVRNAFIRTFDDNLVVRGPFLNGEFADCRDILVEDCTFWSDWAHNFGIAVQDMPCSIEGVTVRRCRVENVAECVSTVRVTMGNRKSIVRDVLFEDIDIVDREGRQFPVVQERDDELFVEKPIGYLKLATVKTGELGVWAGNQRIVRDSSVDDFEFLFDGITYRNFRIEGSGNDKVTAQFFTTIPKHWIRNLRWENMPQTEIESSGNVNLLPGRLGDYQAYELPDGACIGFAMRLGKPFLPSPVRMVTSADMQSFSVSTNSEGVVNIEWKGHPSCGDDFIVSAELRPEAEGFSYGFSYDGNTRGYDVEEIRFPELTVPRHETTRLLYPNQSGMIRLPKWNRMELGEEVCGCGPLFLGFRFVAALNESGDSWYLDQRDDARNYISEFRFFNGDKPGTLRMSPVHVMPVCDANRHSYRLPYGGIIRRYSGGWFEAADIYRQWVWRQPWYLRAAARENAAMRNIALWVWNRGRSDEVSAPVEKAMEDAGVPVALDWYWWHDVGYGAGCPYLWPPREPVEKFRSEISRLKGKGIYTQAYMNGLVCDADDMRTAEYWERECDRNRDGSPYLDVFNPFYQHRSAWLCGTASTYHDVIRSVFGHLADSALDCVYVDMVAHAASNPCWSPSHGHPRGGGTHKTEGYRDVIKRLRKDYPDVSISSEQETEAYIDLFDSLIMLFGDYERLGRGVAPEIEMPPVYPAIYHGAVVMYGSYASVDNMLPWDEKWPKEHYKPDLKDWTVDYPDQFAVDFARPVTWGLQPCVHNFLARHTTDPKFSDEYRFILDTARFYHANRDYLYDGRMLSPGTMRCKTKEVAFLCRGCYTPLGNETRYVQPALPTVMHSVWRTRDGRVGAILVNWTREPQTYELETPDVKSSGELPARAWKLVLQDMK